MKGISSPPDSCSLTQTAHTRLAPVLAQLQQLLKAHRGPLLALVLQLIPERSHVDVLRARRYSSERGNNFT